MKPTFLDGDTVFVNKLFYLLARPRIGDIVVFRLPKDKRLLIKRVVDIRENVFFVIGDNKKESTDSRSYGFIKQKAILGKVLCKLKTKN